MNNSEYFSYDALGLAELVRTKQISSIELLEVAIALTEKLDPKLNAVPIKHFDLARKDLDEIKISHRKIENRGNVITSIDVSDKKKLTE